MDNTEKHYIRVYLVNDAPGYNLKRKQMVNWIKTCCNDYKLIDSAVDGLAYAVFLTEQDYIMFTLKWE
jgi:hypothetical protein